MSHPPSKPRPQRIGIFGGAFDPPHNAHVALARCAVEQLQLDALLVLPTGQAWHKSRTPSPAAQRVAMAQLAFEGIPGAQVDERETRRAGPTYTVDTLAELQAEHPGAQFFLVLGADQAQAFGSWHRWQDIVANAIICIAQRDQSTLTFGVLGSKSGLKIPPNGPIQASAEAQTLAIRMPLMDISATAVRQRVAANLGVAHLVPEAVARYIDNHQLYQTT